MPYNQIPLANMLGILFSLFMVAAIGYFVYRRARLKDFEWNPALIVFIALFVWGVCSPHVNNYDVVLLLPLFLLFLSWEKDLEKRLLTFFVFWIPIALHAYYCVYNSKYLYGIGQLEMWTYSFSAPLLTVALIFILHSLHQKMEQR